MKNQYRIKNLPNSNSFREPAIKLHVENEINDPILIKNTAHVDFNDENLDKVRFVKLNSILAVGVYLAAKYFVDQAMYNSVDESLLLRLVPDGKLKLD